jgi:hypothetical protein
MNATPAVNMLKELQVLKDFFGEKSIQFHNSGRYDEKKLLNADVVIVTGFNKGYVGKGVYSEISNAMQHNIPVFQFSNEVSNKSFYHIIEINAYDTSDVYLKYGLTVPEEDEFEDSVSYNLKQVEGKASKLDLGSTKKGNSPEGPDETDLMY